MNKAILTINYQSLLVSVEDAGKIMNLLAEAVPVSFSYETSLWKPSDTQYVVEVKMLSASEVAKMALSQ